MIDDRVLYEVERDGEFFCVACMVQIRKFPDDHTFFPGEYGLRFANVDWGDNMVPGKFVRETRTGFVWDHPDWGRLTFRVVTEKSWRERVMDRVLYGFELPSDPKELAEWFRRHSAPREFLIGRQDRYGRPIEN